MNVPTSRPAVPALLVAVALSALGCSGGSDDATRLPFASGASIDADAPAERLYLGVTNVLRGSGRIAGSIELTAGAQLRVELATADGSPLRADLVRVRSGGSTETVYVVHAESGFALAPLEATSDGRYLVVLPDTGAPHDVVVHLDCTSDGRRCTPDLQPDEACLLGRPCAEGLVCYPAAGACDITWREGRCIRRPPDDACDAPPGRVCGCDRVTYATSCLARAAGIGIRSDGACGDEAR